MIHLDTSFLVDLLREADRGVQGPANRLFDQIEKRAVRVSLHVVCELLAGAERARNPQQEQSRIREVLASTRIVYPDLRFAQRYAALLAQLEARGQRIGVMDLLIATAALEDAAPLVTRNLHEFQRVPSLEVLSY